MCFIFFFFFFSSRRRHTRWNCDWSSDVCSSDLAGACGEGLPRQVQVAEIADEIHALDLAQIHQDRKSTRLNSSHSSISYAVFCLKKKKKHTKDTTAHTSIQFNSTNATHTIGNHA